MKFGNEIVIDGELYVKQNGTDGKKPFVLMSTDRDDFYAGFLEEFLPGKLARLTDARRVYLECHDLLDSLAVNEIKIKDLEDGVIEFFPLHEEVIVPFIGAIITCEKSAFEFIVSQPCRGE